MKTILKIIAAFFILIICFLSLYYFFAIRPDDDKCRALSTQSSKHNDFYVFVDKLAERRIDKSGKLWVVTWHNLTNMYDAIDTQIVADITHNSVKYLSDAIQVISSPEYDESQKVYTAMVMQKLPIREYMCFMDVANDLFERNIINETVARFIIEPDYELYSTSVNYWWLPDWRKRFKKNANVLLDQRTIEGTLKGEFFFLNPYH